MASRSFTTVECTVDCLRPIKRQNFNGLQILKHLLREQIEHLALQLYHVHFGSTRITELEVIATWNFVKEKYINPACCNASNLESNFDLYNAELNLTIGRAQRRSNFGNSQQFVCDVLSSVTETPLMCHQRPSWVLKMWQNRLAAGTSPRTPQRKLTALPQIP